MNSHGAHNTPRSHAGGREDCWSEGATETLISAWGDRYVRLNRGNLRQKDWKDVADAVNSRQNGVKPPRTDIQCKNRIDTLKKKYKIEKSKPSPSIWPFYSRLCYLIGPNPVTPSNKKFNSGVNSSVKLTRGRNPNPNSSGSNEFSRDDNEEDDDDDDNGVFGARKHSRVESVDLSEESAYKELARSILRFGEIYERIESSKLREMMELEKQRMEFTKELECQRMSMFMDAQLEFAKMDRLGKKTNGSGKKL